jgi:N6-L-threonylcarbamoyladenine synthase
MSIHILAIEASCDDTSAAIISNGRVASNITASQAIHSQYGGVVPELASRAHQTNIIPVVDAALNKAGIKVSELTAIAFTKGPGLLGSLLVGVSFAKGLAISLKIPLIEVNHLHAHVLAQFAMEEQPAFPYLCLLVSGGHTQIIKVIEPLKIELLGSTIDDAAGEAFDKIGKMLGLPYPAGPEIDRLAKSGLPIFNFPISKLDGYQFSFSGLKTAVLYFLKDQISRDQDFVEKNLNNLCASVQATIVETLMINLEKASRDHQIKTIALAGGVSANSSLRAKLLETGFEKGWDTYIPPIEYCTDNAAMIGITGYFKFLKGDFASLSTKAEARLPIEEMIN